jgi:hypothetical protein
MPKHAFQVCPHLFGSDARFQASHHLQPPIGRLAQALLARIDLRVERERNRHIRRFGDGYLNARELGRQHPDERHRHVVDLDDLPDHSGLAAETGTPVSMADHSNGRCCRTIVVGKNRAA